MHIKTRNVNTAFRYFAEFFNACRMTYRSAEGVNIRKTTSRNGAVLMIDEPVTVTYSHPRERVLFNAARDANPFMHLYEALWMLAGRNDVASVAYYAKNMLNYSDDGKTLNGAYGYRWRHSIVKGGPAPHDGTDFYGTTYKNVDQLEILVTHLKAMPDSRRAVLSMWNVEDDLLKIGGMHETTTVANREHRTYEPLPASKDVCCNLNVMFSLRDVSFPQPTYDDGPAKYVGDHVRALDMTVTNRSNDLVWGMLGANYVHFTFLQEYMAARLGAEVGVYHHVTNNLHAYVERPDWKPQAWLDCNEMTQECSSTYPKASNMFPLVKNAAVFEEELPKFTDIFSGSFKSHDPSATVWFEPFLQDVARPMMMAFRIHKMGDTSSALRWADEVKADDWRIAATEWLKRRMK